ncbi:MAG: heme-binding Shp domain-containing protein [Eubacteriales bacterium]|nr:heme-binding Shp domain-containing protein [Eubacteriales bacterium]
MLKNKVMGIALSLGLLFTAALPAMVSAEDIIQHTVDTDKDFSDMKPGAYLSKISGSYLNPETGLTEDGGTKNASIGEGMVDGVVTPSDASGGLDSVFGKPKPGEEHYSECLLEKMEDGKYYATLRLYLMNYIKFDEQNGPFIEVRQPNGEYKRVEYKITKSESGGENGVNFNDFRFEVPNANTYVKVSMFVVPMSRPVTYFVVIDSEETQPGPGEFVASPTYGGKAGGLSTGAIAGIAGGAAVVIIIVVALVVKRKKSSDTEEA